MLSCKQASELASKAQDRSLPLRKKISLRTHLMICKMCRRYAKQIRFISRASRRLTEGDRNIHLSDESRERIARKIKHSSDEKKSD